MQSLNKYYGDIVKRKSMSIEPTNNQNGFDQLRKHIKHGNLFCKELNLILQERCDLEVHYAKSLQKLSARLLKISKDGLGSINQAWQTAGAEMEFQADQHRQMAVSLTEDLVKPLQCLTNTQHRVRKSVESMMEKLQRHLTERRTAESRARRLSYQSARDTEKAADQVLDFRLGRNNKTMTDKDTAKMEAKFQKCLNAASKADIDYYNSCIRAERARVEWEAAVYKGAQCFQSLEEERLYALKSYINVYSRCYTEMCPRIVESCERFTEPLSACDVTADVQAAIALKSQGHDVCEQFLPDFYAEDLTNAMNRDRRIQSLESFSNMLQSDLDKEQKAISGLQNLSRAIKETPSFASDTSESDIVDRMQNMKSVVVYLECSKFKVDTTLAEVLGNPRPENRLSQFIEYRRDKQGAMQSLLKIPSDIYELSSEERRVTDLAIDSDFDEFSTDSQLADNDVSSNVANPTAALDQSTKYCTVLHDYSASRDDELCIQTGDRIQLIVKLDRFWWKGVLNGKVGMFPASYVTDHVSNTDPGEDPDIQATDDVD